MVGYNDFSMGVVGSSHLNSDGSSRRDEVERCRPGEPIYFVREPTNPVDPAAVAVFSSRWIQVGYLAATRCGWIGAKLDRGYDVRVIVERVNYLDVPGMLPKLVVLVNMEGDDPEIRLPASRRAA